MSAKLVDVEETTLWNAEYVTGSTVSSIHQHDVMQHFSVWFSIADGAPVAQSFTTANITTTGNYIKKVAHGLYTGIGGNLTGTGALLPTGLATATTYYAIRLSADTFQLADSRANALAGTPVVLAADNTVSAFHPAAIGTIDVHLQASLDGTNYWNVASTTLTGVGQTVTSVANIAYNYLRVDCTLSAGQALITAKCRSIGGD